MPVMFGLVAPRYGFIEVNAGAGRYLLAIEIHVDVQRAKGGVTQHQGRDQNLPPFEDQAGGDDDVADRPFFIIEIEILHLADV